MNILESLQKLIDLGLLEFLMQLASNPLFLIMMVAIVPWFVLRGVLLAWLQSQQKHGRK
jgi:hypothetical protein